jgi:hypothetical protein
MNVYLLPIGRQRFDIYSEPAEETHVPPASDAGWIRRWIHAGAVQWHALVDTARGGASTGRIARWRDQIVCHLAESIAEQRTLWALAREAGATLLFPATMKPAAARASLDRVLMSARRHHGFWLIVDVPLFIGSAVLTPIPGPNVIAYYFAFRAVGHLLSWRGARQGLLRTVWYLEADRHLAELASLVETPHAQREARVHAIAEQLNLRRLSAFFQRVAA